MTNTKPKPKTSHKTLKTTSVKTKVLVNKGNSKYVTQAIKLQEKTDKLRAKRDRLENALKLNKPTTKLYKSVKDTLKKTKEQLKKSDTLLMHKINEVRDHSSSYTKTYRYGAKVRVSALNVNKRNIEKDFEKTITFSFVSNISIPGSDGQSIEAGTVVYRTLTEGSIKSLLDEMYGLELTDVEILTITKEVRTY